MQSPGKHQRERLGESYNVTLLHEGGETFDVVISSKSPFDFHFTTLEEDVQVVVDKLPTSSSFKVRPDAEMLCQEIIKYEKDHCPCRGSVYNNTASALLRDAALEGNNDNSSSNTAVEVNGWLVDQHLNMRSNQCTLVFQKSAGPGRAGITCQQCSTAFAKANVHVSRDNRKCNPEACKTPGETRHAKSWSAYRSQRRGSNRGAWTDATRNRREEGGHHPEEYGYYIFFLWQESVKAYKSRIHKNTKMRTTSGIRT